LLQGALERAIPTIDLLEPDAAFLGEDLCYPVL